MNKTGNMIHVAMICDVKVVEACCVAISSIRSSKSARSSILVHIIDCGLQNHDRRKLLESAETGIQIEFIEPVDVGLEYQNTAADSIASANQSALQKFFLPQMLPELGVVLYLDCDILVRGDLESIFHRNIAGCLGAVVPDSGRLYYRSGLVDVERYFNSGVMLLNLDCMREEGVTEKLLLAKRNICKGNLVDQDAFNFVFNGRVEFLPVRYNCLCVNLDRARQKIDMSAFNKLFDASYGSISDVISDATILHFASRDKPWHFSDVMCAQEWYTEFEKLPHLRIPGVSVPAISIVVPVYNLEKYLVSCIDSLLQQGIEDLEIIIVDDGSVDRSGAIMDAYSRRDSRISVLRQANGGQSSARNAALRVARGEYIYFMDGDDLLVPGSLANLYKQARSDNLDVLYFDGATFFESEDLEKAYGHYRSYYLRGTESTGVMSGLDMLRFQEESRSIKPSPCLQILRRDFLLSNAIFFQEGVIYEDNIFSFQIARMAGRTRYVAVVCFLRRVRPGSTMTTRKGVKSYESYVRVASELLRDCSRSDLPVDIREICYRIVRGMIQSAFEVYLELQHSERLSYDPMLGTNESFFHKLIQVQAGFFARKASSASRTPALVTDRASTRESGAAMTQPEEVTCLSNTRIEFENLSSRFHAKRRKYRRLIGALLLNTLALVVLVAFILAKV